MSGFAGVSCIVPAYNEAPRIVAVLEVLAGHPMIAEVIVVDDGSTDGTADLAGAFAADRPGMRVIRQVQNGGKTRAVAVGIEAARQDHLMLIDSDLLGLAPEHLTALLEPVASGRADASISLRRNAPRTWHFIGIDYISGERVMPRDVFAGQQDALRALPRFGLEVFMNEIWLKRDFRIGVAHWPEVKSPLKSVKQGRVSGLQADLRMLRDIFGTVGVARTVYQIQAMRARRV